MTRNVLLYLLDIITQRLSEKRFGGEQLIETQKIIDARKSANPGT